MEEKSIPTCTGGHRKASYYAKESKLQEEVVEELNIGYIDGVYHPSHDTFILLEAVKYVINRYVSSLNKGIALELGSGTGFVSTYLAKLGRISYAIMIDIDSKAVYSSWATAKANNIDAWVDVIQCDAATCIRSKVVDISYFNPPYLPVCDDLPDAVTWSGGEDGLGVWGSFFSESLRVCRSNCWIVFVFSSLQDLKKMFNQISSCKHIEILECKAFFYEVICGTVVKCM